MTEYHSQVGVRGVEPGKFSPAMTRFYGHGYVIGFQDGTISQYGVNGTTNEEILRVLITRLTSLNEMQDGKFRCRENSLAITHLEEALHWLWARTKNRQERGVEGTDTP